MQSLFDTLTCREREVLALVATGLMNKQIAAELGLAEITVKIHRGHIIKKWLLIKKWLRGHWPIWEKGRNAWN